MASRLSALLLWPLLVGSVAAVSGQELADEGGTGVADPPEFVAIVNGEKLFVEDVESVLNRIHQDVAAQDRSGFDLEQMLFRLINDTLLAQEARALGLDREEEIQASAARLRESLAARRLEREEIFSKIVIDEERLEKLYDELFETATLRIVTRRDRDEAEAILERIRTGEDLETIARDESQDPYSGRGGLMNKVPRIDFPAELAEAAFAMESGQTGGPVTTGYGWTVFQVEAIEPADPELFTRRRRDVRDVIGFRQRQALRTELLARLREKHEVVLNEEVYDAIRAEKMPDGRLLPTIDDSEAVVVEAGGRKITAARYGMALASRWGGIASEEAAEAIKPLLLDNLTVDELITAEALARGYDRGPSVDRQIHALETRLLVKRFLEEVVVPQVDPTKDEIASYFESNKERFKRPPRLFVSQLTVESEEEAERLAALVRGGTDFGWLAQRNSLDKFGEAGGKVGWISASTGIRGFAEELKSAETGDLFGPKGAQDRWTLVHVSAVEDQGYYDLDEVSGNVRSALESARYLQLIDEYINRLRERSEIVVNEEVVAQLRMDAGQVKNEDGPAAPGHGG